MKTALKRNYACDYLQYSAHATPWEARTNPARPFHPAEDSDSSVTSNHDY